MIKQVTPLKISVLSVSKIELVTHIAVTAPPVLATHLGINCYTHLATNAPPI